MYLYISSKIVARFVSYAHDNQDHRQHSISITINNYATRIFILKLALLQTIVFLAEYVNQRIHHHQEHASVSRRQHGQVKIKIVDLKASKSECISAQTFIQFMQQH